MPQMAPINWLTLYFIFLSVYLIFIILNYFMFLYTPKISYMSSYKIVVNWKW